MISEDHEIPNGWPLGLNNVSVRLMVEGSQAAAAEPYASHLPSTSFSSFSSSNLDTEINQSTASFFRDQSVSLGRLIGIRPGDRGTLYLPNTVRSEEHENASVGGSQLDVSKGCGAEMNQGICVPLLLGFLEKMSKSKSNSRQ